MWRVPRSLPVSSLLVARKISEYFGRWASLVHPLLRRQHRGELGDGDALHVEDAPPDDPRRIDPALEGGHDPVLGTAYRIDIEVVVEDQRLLGCPLEDRPQVRLRARMLFNLDRQAGVLQDPRQVASGVDLPAPLGRRVDPDQGLQPPDILVRLVVDSGPGRVEDRRRRTRQEHDANDRHDEQCSVERDPGRHGAPRVQFRAARHQWDQLSNPCGAIRATRDPVRATVIGRTDGMAPCRTAPTAARRAVRL